MSNIKQVRRDLRQWGNFWASKQEVQGYSNKSNVQKIKECCDLGGTNFSSDLHLHSHGSSGIYTPEHIESLTKRINQLNDYERLALIGKYIKKLHLINLVSWAGFPNKSSAELWLLKAEQALL
ncbi:hypothetical protein L1077_21655 [Pseudoalteromonas luteoviolacea]|uniref:hypothetical protein n=1 Tax=Pseudoalteromonas luteoviolacea TaxID=43657 RepID=UPI001F35B89A|nr:hypothetical protein [Pseudoalteromonas luteoviolacea]MCF6442040.1 hypothetical protein [Pseudoalteromonas luteoviolacea]